MPRKRGLTLKAKALLVYSSHTHSWRRHTLGFRLFPPPLHLKALIRALLCASGTFTGVCPPSWYCHCPEETHLSLLGVFPDCTCLFFFLQ